jgi:hypothetical protein
LQVIVALSYRKITEISGIGKIKYKLLFINLDEIMFSMFLLIEILVYALKELQRIINKHQEPIY